MTKLNKGIKNVCKVLEVLLWIGEAGMVVVLGCFLFMGDKMVSGMEKLLDSGNLNVSGMELTLINGDGSVSKAACIAAFISMIIMISFVAMIFRNTYLIYKTSEGATKYSVGATPFQPENVRMIKEIGIFAIAIPVVELIASIVNTLIISPQFAEVSVSVTSVLFGFILLSLSQYFAYGAKLQEEVDGLL